MPIQSRLDFRCLLVTLAASGSVIAVHLTPNYIIRAQMCNSSTQFIENT